MPLAGWPREGSLGVDLFFVLSGFLITVLLLEERIATGTTSLRRFWRRRAARLAPALLVMLGVYALATGGANTGAIVFGATYTSNVASAIDRTTMPWSLGHLWSLAQEEKFYLLWPPILLLVARIRPQLLPRVVIALVVAVLLEKIALLASGASDERLYFGPDTHADPILIGCLFGSIFASRGVPRLIQRWRHLLGLLSLIAIVGIIAWPPELSPFKAISPVRVFFAIACGLLILTAFDGSTAERLLSLRPLPFLARSHTRSTFGMSLCSRPCRNRGR